MHPHPRLQQLHRHLASPITPLPLHRILQLASQDSNLATLPAGFGVFEAAVSEGRYAHHPIPRNLGANGYFFGAKRNS